MHSTYAHMCAYIWAKWSYKLYTMMLGPILLCVRQQKHTTPNEIYVYTFFYGCICIVCSMLRTSHGDLSRFMPSNYTRISNIPMNANSQRVIIIIECHLHHHFWASAQAYYLNYSTKLLKLIVVNLSGLFSF